MHIFVTGATGWIGSAVCADLIAAGHTVTGLARSADATSRLTAAGATPHPGDLRDHAALRAAASQADGVAHLGFIHDFAAFAESGRVEHAAVTTIGDALAGSGKPFVIASGLAGHGSAVITEQVPSPFHGPESLRGGSENLALSYAARGVRSVAMRFAPTVHGAGDGGFVASLVGVARDSGVSAYVGDGSGSWAAVHRSDAARLVRLALESAPAGSIAHAVAEEAIPTRQIAEAIGAGLGVPVRSVDPADATAHFGWVGRFFAGDIRASSTLTQDRYGWQPTGPTLAADLAGRSYFED